MAKRICCFFLTVCMICSIVGNFVISAAMEIYYDDSWHTYTGNTFRLQVNGKTLSCSVPPIVFQDYSVVPARDVFEHLGATVSWYGPEEKVTVDMKNTQIVLYIDSTVAYKNKKAESMPIAPKIINGKTMIPVRYVAESLGFTVTFDSKTDTIGIKAPVSETPNKPTTPQTPAEKEEPSVEPSITLKSYKGTQNGDIFSIRFTMSEAVTDISDFVLTEPNRIVVDLADVKLGTGVGNSTYTSDVVTAVRYGQHGLVLRIVLDTTEKYPYRVSVSGKTVTVTVGEGSSAGNTTTKPNTTDTPDKTEKPDSSDKNDEKPAIPGPPDIVIEPSRSITIDPGHGGEDPGAIFTDEDGTVWRETDINLAVALKVRDILKKHNVRVVMTRTKEETVVRRSRPDLANEEKTALFISIHTNSVQDAEKANGIETWGSLETSKPLAGVDDKSFAKNVQEAVIKKTKATDRGLKDSIDLTVLVYSAMPSVLIEVGFISNETERANMFSESYRNKLAEGIAEGILKTFDDMGV